MGAVLDLGNIGLGGNWTVQSQDGKRIVVAQTVGDTIINREITPEQYDVIKNDRFNAANINRSRKGVADVGQAFSFVDNSRTNLEVAGFDGQSRKYLVTGTVNGEHVSQWIDENAARSLSRGQFEGEVSKAMQGDRVDNKIIDLRERAKEKKKREKEAADLSSQEKPESSGLDEKSNNKIEEGDDAATSPEKEVEKKNAEKIETEVSREPISVQMDERAESPQEQSGQQMVQELRTARRGARSPRGSLQSGTQAREMSIPTLDTPTISVPSSTAQTGSKGGSIKGGSNQVNQTLESTAQVPGQTTGGSTSSTMQVQNTVVAQAQATLGVLQQQGAGIQQQRKMLGLQRQAMTEQLSRFQGYLKEAKRTGRDDHARTIRSQMQKTFEQRAALIPHESALTIESSTNRSQQQTIQRALAHPTPEILAQLQRQQQLVSLDDIPELDLEPDIEQEDLLSPPPIPKMALGVPSSVRRASIQPPSIPKQALAQTLRGTRSPLHLATDLAGGKQRSALAERGLGETRDQMIMGNASDLPQPVLQVGAPLWAQDQELSWMQQQAKERQTSEAFTGSESTNEQEVGEEDIVDESPADEYDRARELREAQEAERLEDMIEPDDEDEDEGEPSPGAPPEEKKEEGSSLPLSGFVNDGKKTFLRMRALGDLATFWSGAALLDFIQIRIRQLPLISKKLPKQLRLPDSSLMGQVGTIGCFLFLILLIVLVIAAIALLIIASLYPLIALYAWIKSIFS